MFKNEANLHLINDKGQQVTLCISNGRRCGKYQGL